MGVLRGLHTILPDIPAGRKDGMFFIINNAPNADKRQNGTRSEFWDDCDAWKNSATPAKALIHRGGRFVSVIKRGNEFCIEKKIQKKRQYIPLASQPTENDLLAVHRLYQTLKAFPSGPNQFKRKITWLENIPDSLANLPNNIALVEYIGVPPPRIHHGNVKLVDKNSKYLKTKPEVRNALKEILKHETVNSIERAMNQKTSNDLEKQRNKNQLGNLKYSLTSYSRSPFESSKNVADNEIFVQEMTETHEYLMSVIHLQGINHPVINLYTDQQIRDIKRFCCKEDVAVLGIDKTYNIGVFHVTPTVNKDLPVLRRTTLDHTLCFGPTFYIQILV